MIDLKNVINIYTTVETKLTQETKDILVGTILGDAHIRRNKTSKKASLTFEQSSKNKEYLFSLHQKLIKFSNQDTPKKRLALDKRYNKINISYHFDLLQSELFFPLSKLFLQHKITDNK
jgi:hypothetical protein